MSNSEILTEQSVSKLFENVEYEIPIYQRNYAWKAEHIEQLINDINDVCENQTYYLGSLIVNKKGPNSYEVIDGQQRLTTLFLLHKVLYGKTVKNVLKFEARQIANNTLKNIGDHGDKEFYVPEIVEGYEVIKKMIGVTVADKEDFIKKLDKVSIIRVQVPENIDLNHYFEIMNTRGEQLELHEIVKAKVLSVLSSEHDKKTGAIIWDACAKMNTYIQMNIAKDKRKGIFGDNWDQFKPKTFDCLACCFNESEHYAVNTSSLLSILEKKDVDFKNNISAENEENSRFEPIINFPNFILQVNKAVAECDNLDDKRFIANMAKHYESEENAKLFLFNFLKYRFLFDKYIVKREYAKNYKEDGRWSLQQLQRYREEGAKGDSADKPKYVATFSDDKLNKQIRTLQSCFRITYTSPKVMHWIHTILKETSNDIATETLLHKLEKYGIGEVEKADYKNRKGFELERIVYSYLDYILYRDGFEKHLETERSDFYFQFRNSVEHFYPQNPAEDDRWDDNALNGLGNLALITISGNSKFSNISPDSKLKTYPSVIKQSLKLVLMSKMMDQRNGWTKDISEDHGKVMLDLLKKECSKLQTTEDN